MCKAERPQSEVGGRVGNGAKDEFDGLNELMDEDLGEVVVFGLRGESRVVLNIEKASFFVLWV